LQYLTSPERVGAQRQREAVDKVTRHQFDRDGKQVGNPISVNFPNSVVRLNNGNILVGSLNNRSVTEFDRNGRAVWTHQSDGMVFNARRR